MVAPKLVFPKVSGSNEGFSADLYDLEGMSDEHVIRELVQNCMDNRVENSNIQFEFIQLPLDDIAGIDQYRDAFQRVLPELRKGAVDAKISGRIKTMLAKDTVDILICRDNGTGLGLGGYRSLISKAATDKHGAANRGKLGSAGVGHLTALKASGLRFALYGSMSTEYGTMFSGQAFLATHRNGKQRHSAQGFLAPGDLSNDDFDAMEYEPCREIPEWLGVKKGGHTGTAVAIVGFELLDNSSKSLGATIACSIAKHFTVAVSDGLLTATFTDNRTDSDILEQSVAIDTDTLDIYLRDISHEKRAKVAGLGAGHDAYNAWQAINTLPGSTPELDGVRIWLTKDAQALSTRSRVTVFRGGMRITDTAPGLEPANFPGVNLFTASVDAESDSHCCITMRDSEEGSHLRFDMSRHNPYSAELKRLFELIADYIRDQAGHVDTETFTPPSLRLFDISRFGQKPDPAPPPVVVHDLNPDEDEDAGEDEEEYPDRPENPAPPAPNPDPPTPKPPNPGSKLITGNVEGIRSSVIPSLQGDSGTSPSVLVVWDLGDTKLPSKTELSIQVGPATGSDRSAARYEPLEPMQVRVLGSVDEFAESVRCDPHLGQVHLEITPEDADISMTGKLAVRIARKRQEVNEDDSRPNKNQGNLNDNTETI